jgi:hypothetical protein
MVGPQLPNSISRHGFLVKAGLNPAEGPDPEHVATGFHERAETLLHMAASARYCYEDFDEIDEKSTKKHLRPVILEPFEELAAVPDHFDAKWCIIADCSDSGTRRLCRILAFETTSDC